MNINHDVCRSGPNRAEQGFSMKVRIINRRLPDIERAPDFGDNIFSNIHDASAPRAIVPHQRLSQSAEVVYPTGFQSVAPEKITRKTPELLRGVSSMSAKTQVVTASGGKTVGELSVGEQILTRDNGFQKLRWTGYLPTKSNSTMVEIQSSAIDAGIPSDVLHVSGRQRVLLTCPEIADQFGTREVLVRAGDLLHLEGVNEIECNEPMVAMLFDRQEVLRANDAWLDTMTPDKEALEQFSGDERQEIRAIFPQMNDVPLERSYPSARPVLRSEFARQFQRFDC